MPNLIFNLMIVLGMLACVKRGLSVSATSDTNRTEAAATCKCDNAREVRSDDTDPYKAVIAEHSQHIQQLTAQLQAVTNKLKQKVAFYSHFKEVELTSVGPRSTVIFNAVDINIGSGYDADTGIFRAPFAGVYMFHVKMLSSINYTMRLDIFTANKKLIATTESWADPAREVATAQGIVHLDADQSVWVTASPMFESENKAGHMHGSVYTTFSGYLLYSPSRYNPTWLKTTLNTK